MIWEKNDLDLGGLTMQFAKGDNQGLDDVFLTEIDANGGFKPIGSPGS